MKKFLFPLLLFPFLVKAQNNFKLIQETPSYVILEYTLDVYKLQPLVTDAKSYQTIDAPNTYPFQIAGAPDVRRTNININIPLDAKPKIEILNENFVIIPDIDLISSKGSLKRNINPANVPYTFNETYTKNEFFPSSTITTGNLFSLRSQHGLTVSAQPFSYNPVTRELKVTSKVKVKVSFNSVNGKRATNIGSQDESNIYKNVFVNFQPALYTPIAEQGSMLIIYADAFQSSVKTLADWKNQKGIKTSIIPISEIGNTQTNIYNYIHTYYAGHPDLLYVLLVGDHNEVNCADAGMAGSEVKWSDTYYAFHSGTDVYPELFIGRFSGSTTAEIETQVNRTLEYEKNPSTGNWYSSAVTIGSDEGAGYGDDGEADWQHERNMGTLLTNWGYSNVYEFFDGSHGGNDAAGNPTPTMVSAAVNSGASLFLYTGHGWDGGCATSNYTSTEVSNSTNNGKYPFAISVACNNGTFTQGTCFAEEFVRASNTGGPTGAIACMGSSILMAWAEPMSTQDEIVDILTDQYTNNKKTSLGGLFYNGQMKMLTDYMNATADEVMESWVFFGDPSCVMRSKSPTQITANVQACYSSADNNILITSPDENSLAALWSNEVLLGTAYIQGGSATIPFTNNGSSVLTVTLSDYNKIPAQIVVAPCAVGMADQQTQNMLLFPNPCTDKLFLKGVTSNAVVKIYDALGMVVFKGILANDQSVDVSVLSKGIYFMELSVGSTVSMNKFIKE